MRKGGKEKGGRGKKEKKKERKKEKPPLFSVFANNKHIIKQKEVSANFCNFILLLGE